jgi:hypothetical protein
MSDRELLELAAKAAGYGEVWTLDNYPNTFYIGPRYTGGAPKYRAWNPLTDDGDALRLAVKLGMDVCIDTPKEDRPHTHAIGFSSPYASESFGVVENHESDPYAATRRAIVRAAAEIGRNMP